MIALDTNILAYAAFADADPRKAIAVDIVMRAALIDAVLPLQVLIEFGNAALKRRQLPVEAAAQRVGEWSSAFRTVPTRSGDILAALVLVRSARLAYFDALIITVARGAGATTLLSEDMADGEIYDGVRLLNPFNPANETIVAQLLA